MGFWIPGIVRSIAYAGARRIGATAGAARFGSLARVAGRPLRHSQVWSKLSQGLSVADDVMQTVEGAVWIGSELFGSAMQSTGDRNLSVELSENLLLYREGLGTNKVQAVLALQSMVDNDTEWPLLVYSAIYPGKLSGTDTECAALAASLIQFYNDEKAYKAFVTSGAFIDMPTWLKQNWTERTWGQFIWDNTLGWGEWIMGSFEKRTTVKDVVTHDIMGVKQLVEMGSFILFMRTRFAKAIEAFNNTQKDAKTKILPLDAIGIVRFVQNYCRTNWATDQQMVAAIPTKVTPEEIQKYWARQTNEVIAAVLEIAMSSEVSVRDIVDHDTVIARLNRILQDTDRIYSPQARDEVYDFMVAAAERVKRDLI